MGFSVSASTAIIFAGLFLAFGILFPAVSNGFDQVRDAQVDRDDAQLDLRNTQIEIVDTDAGANEIIVKNTGTTSLSVPEIDLIVDGEYRGQEEFSNDDNPGSDLWLPGENVTASPNPAISSDERIKVVTEHGISVSTEV